MMWVLAPYGAVAPGLVGPKTVRMRAEDATARWALPVSLEITSEERFMTAIEVIMSAPTRSREPEFLITDMIPSARSFSLAAPRNTTCAPIRSMRRSPNRAKHSPGHRFASELTDPGQRQKIGRSIPAPREAMSSRAPARFSSPMRIEQSGSPSGELSRSRK